MGESHAQCHTSPSASIGVQSLFLKEVPSAGMCSLWKTLGKQDFGCLEVLPTQQRVGRDAPWSGAPGWDLEEGMGAGTQGHCPSRETNMKVRQAIPVTSELGDISKLAKFDGE